MKFSYLKSIVIFFILLAFCLYGLFQISKSRSFQFFGGITNRVSTTQKKIALTFDDAPNGRSDEILEILSNTNTKATFYVVGRALQDYPEQGKRIAQEGHEIGNHSYSHQRFLLQSLSFIDTEIQQTNMLIRETGYQGEITFRPPNGKKLFALPWYLRQHNIPTIMWDVEPDTYAPQTTDELRAQFLIDYTLKNTQPGSIILLHPFCEKCSSDRQALPQIIAQFQSQGYEFVTVSQLLQEQP